MPLRVAVLGTLLLTTSLAAQAQRIDTLRLSKRDFQTKNLRPHTARYLVYTQAAKASYPQHYSLWTRRTAVTTWQGRPVFVVDQQWQSGDSTLSRRVYSINDQATFAPLYHYSRWARHGVEAYNFAPERVVGADSVAQNRRKGFTQELTGPTLNWELDLETFRTLPYGPGRKFAISFYHPGGKLPPKFYLYEVAGTESIATFDGQQITCWLLRIRYSDTMHATFWVSKRGHEVIKMEEYSPSGTRYKIQLSTGPNPPLPGTPKV